MNATERAALLNGFELHDEMTGIVDERTLEILDRRRRTSVVRRRGWLVRRMLVAADVVGLLTAMLFVEWIVTTTTNAGILDARAETLAFIGTLPGWIVVAKLYGLYDRDEERTDHSTADEFAGVFHMVTVCTWIFWALSYITGIAHPTPAKLVLFWVAAVAFVTLARSAGRALARRSLAYFQNTVIVGAGDVGQLIARKLLQHREYGLNIVGFVDANPRERRNGLEHLPLLGGPERLPAIVRLFDVERVVVAFSNESHEDTLELVQSLKDLDVQVDIVPRLFEAVGPNFALHMVEGLPLVGLRRLKLSRSSAFLKRVVDVAVSASALLLLLPLLLVIAVAVKLDGRGPVLYRHERVGRSRKRINVLKFRTMRLEACRGARYGGEVAEALFEALIADPERARQFEDSYKLNEDPRTTRVGRVLRETSLDELPQLINVLRGDLSLVGPRAITVDELPRYGERVDDLLGIRPGVTGYWQINGRSRLNYQDRVRLDLSYIAGWSLSLDLAILAKTFRVLVRRKDAF